MTDEYLHNNREIEILDSIMGSGKTQGIIKWMKDNPQNKYLYVSPLLSEVDERIPEACESLGFVSPNSERGRKKDHLLELLQEGHNVSFTHSLFTDLTREHLEWIDINNYTLIIDEEIDFIEPYKGKDYQKADILTLERSGHVWINEDSLGRVEWKWDEDKFEGGNYSKLKRMCDLEMLHCAKRSREMMVLHLPISLIAVTERTIVLTYLFKGSVMNRFMEMKGLEVKDFTEIPLMHTEAEIKQTAAERIEVFAPRTVRKLPQSHTLTYSWYSQKATKDDLKRVGRAITNACVASKRPKEEVMYTLPADVGRDIPKTGGSRSPKITIGGYHRDDCFLYCGTKATNNYSHKTVLVHAYNRYPQQVVNAYLADYWLPVDTDNFALSELIQWIWRSNIRVSGAKEKVYVCFLSRRMEKLFTDWLDGYTELD